MKIHQFLKMFVLPYIFSSNIFTDFCILLISLFPGLNTAKLNLGRTCLLLQLNLYS